MQVHLILETFLISFIYILSRNVSIAHILSVLSGVNYPRKDQNLIIIIMNNNNNNNNESRIGAGEPDLVVLQSPPRVHNTGMYYISGVDECQTLLACVPVFENFRQ